MDFKKLSSGAGTLFNRAKQFTEEKIGSAEKTVLDEAFQAKLDQSDKTKNWTEKIIKQTECFLQPNTAARVEDKMQETLKGFKATRLMESDVLGQVCLDAGNDLSAGAPGYGGALVKCGEVYQKLGAANRDFIQTAVNNFLQPLQGFLDGDMKSLQRERSTLELKRLDLDSVKSKLKRTKQPPTTEQERTDLAKVEAELKASQSAFDGQVDVANKLCDSVLSAHEQHLRALQDLVQAQAAYYAQCSEYTAELHKQLSSR
jgi:endophilin-B